MKKLLPIFLLFAACGPAKYLPCPPMADAGDTVPSKILISAEPPAFGHSIDGYCLYKDSVCTGQHLKYWRNHFIEVGPEYTVWQCKRRAKQ